MGAGALILNQPGVYLVDVDGNAITVTDGLAIGSAEALIIAGKDGSNARFIRVASDGTVRTDPTGTTTQPVSAASLPLPTGAATEATLSAINTKIPASPSQEHVTAGSPHSVRLSDGSAFYKATTPADTQPVSAASLPLPTGAATEATLALIKTKTDNLDVALSTRATEATLATRLADATFTGRINTLGQKTMANSTPVVLSSDQSAIPVTDNGGSLTVDGTVTSNQGTAATLAGAWPVQVTDGTNTMPTMDIAARSGWQRLTDGTNGPVAVKAASTAPVATDKALVVVLSPNDATLASRLADATFTARVNVLGQNTAANSTPVVLASDQTVVPVSDNGGSLTVDGTVTANQGTAAALTGAWPVKHTDGTNTMPTMDAIGRAGFQKITDGTNVQAVKAASAAPVASDPAAVVVLSPNDATLASRLADSTFTARVNTLGQKLMAASTPVVLASDHSQISVTFTQVNAVTGASSANLLLGGGTAGTLQVLRSTAYTEPTSAAQRSVGSSNANDTSVGTGARSVVIKYFDNSGAGPFEETVTLNGTTPVNTVATNIRFIESIRVATVGSGGANAGTITLYGSTAGGGGTVGTIAVGTVVTGVGDNTTLWAHHYTPVGWELEVATLTASVQSGGSGTSGKVFLRAAHPLVANSADVIFDGVLLLSGTFRREYQFKTKLTGFARVVAYAIPAVNNTEISVAFDWSEVPI